MTKEDRQLLFRELCERIPYDNTKVRRIVHTTETDTIESVEHLNLYWLMEFQAGECDLIPYLRPMSSMTEEEKEEFISFNGTDGCYIKTMDFCHKHHLDNRGLIPMGLAIEAPEGMYDR